MSVCCECCVLSDRGLCAELITHPEESYRLWCVVVCDLETTKILVNEAKAHWGAIERERESERRERERERKKRILRKIFGPAQNEDGSWRIRMNHELKELI